MGETKTTPAKVIQHALASHYSPPAPGPAVAEGDELLSMLETLPSLSVDEHIDTMQGRSANIFLGEILTLSEAGSRSKLMAGDADFKLVRLANSGVESGGAAVLQTWVLAMPLQSIYYFHCAFVTRDLL